jgi:hypothetical protein
LVLTGRNHGKNQWQNQSLCQRANGKVKEYVCCKENKIMMDKLHNQSATSEKLIG